MDARATYLVAKKIIAHVTNPIIKQPAITPSKPPIAVATPFSSTET